MPAHHALLGAGVWVVEGVNLAGILPGRYDLICLPLRIVGGDGSPCRVLVDRGSRLDRTRFGCPSRSVACAACTRGIRLRPGRLTNLAQLRLNQQMDAIDVQDVNLARTGDEGAFRRLVERHSRLVFQVAYRMTGNEPDAEDVVQDDVPQGVPRAEAVRGAVQLRHLASSNRGQLRVRPSAKAATSEGGSVGDRRWTGAGADAGGGRGHTAGPAGVQRRGGQAGPGGDERSDAGRAVGLRAPAPRGAVASTKSGRCWGCR